MLKLQLDDVKHFSLHRPAETLMLNLGDKNPNSEGVSLPVSLNFVPRLSPRRSKSPGRGNSAPNDTQKLAHTAYAGSNLRLFHLLSGSNRNTCDIRA